MEKGQKSKRGNLIMMITWKKQAHKRLGKECVPLVIHLFKINNNYLILNFSIFFCYEAPFFTLKYFR